MTPLDEASRLKQAIDSDDFEAVKELLTRNPALHNAAIGYGGNGALTWAAECRLPGGPPPPDRLAIAKWMIENGSGVHQGGDGPLSRAALNGDRVPMMELLVAHGADVNAEWNGNFPILFSPCECVDPVALEWLLRHGADPNCSKPDRRDTALDYLIATYIRSPELGRCIDLLLEAGGVSRYNLPGVIPTILDRVDELAAALDQNPDLVHHRFPELDCGATGARRLLLAGATLLHVAAEFGSTRAAGLLLDRGADVNVRAATDDTGIGGQTPLFHAVTQYDDYGLAITQLLLARGADLSVKARVPGHYERLDEFLDDTPVEYALRFPGGEFPGSNQATLSLLQRRTA